MLVEMQVSLAGALRQGRFKRGLSQVELAQRMRSSQSRVARRKHDIHSCRIPADLITLAHLS
jgi:transcriptional regulator with XRE-family HTH domain